MTEVLPETTFGPAKKGIRLERFNDDPLSLFTKKEEKIREACKNEVSSRFKERH
jgi:hypothetical protein